MKKITILMLLDADVGRHAYSESHSYSNGLAKVESLEERYGFIDRTDSVAFSVL